jgi:hypothetical protein
MNFSSVDSPGATSGRLSGLNAIKTSDNASFRRVCLEEQKSIQFLKINHSKINHSKIQLNPSIIPSITNLLPCNLPLSKSIIDPVENIGVEPMTSCLQSRRSSQLS